MGIKPEADHMLFPFAIPVRTHVLLLYLLKSVSHWLDIAVYHRVVSSPFLTQHIACGEGASDD